MTKVGDVIQTMEFGHIVNAEITECLESNEWGEGRYSCKLLSHYKSGNTEFWLDCGQGVKAYPGYTFTTSDHYINCAANNIEKYNVIPETYVQVLKEGGSWIAAVRTAIQTNFKNGERVAWNSNDILEPCVTVAQIEEIAARAVAADRRERSRHEITQ